MTGYPTTLVEALDRLPGSQNADGSLRGFRFLTTDREDRFYSYADLRAEAHRRAAILASHGLEKGDTVALVCPENHEFVLTFLGASVGGFVPVPIFPGATFKASDHYIDTLEHIAQAARSKVLVCITKNLEVIEKLEERASTKDLIILAADRDFAGEAPAFTPPTVTPEDLCFLQFTSGSTNKPKGVAIKHKNLVANTTSFLGPDGLARTREDVGVSWLPLFHDMGLIGFVLGTLIVDLPVVLFQTSTFVRMPRLWLELITKHKGTITYAPNFAYDLLTKRVTEKDLATLDLSSLRVAGCGAEPIRARTLTDFAAKFAKCGFDANALLPSYGMAESCLAITFHQRGTPMIVDKVDADELRRGKAVQVSDAGGDASRALELVSCGVPFPGHELAIVDENGQAVGERVVGQILSKGPSVNDGYFENAEATAESFKDGWLHSGDLGYRAGGNVYICGRVKDLLIVNGANHYPQDIEWVVGDLEGVRRGNVVAFSVMRDGLEQLVVAAEGNSGDASRLKTEIARVVSETFGLTPAHVAICPVGALPKTSSGKAQRRKSKTMWESRELEEHP
jgi:fatty-acyl-CoA synthase